MVLRPCASVLDPAAVIARVACTSSDVNRTSVESRSAAKPATATSPNPFIHTGSSGRRHAYVSLGWCRGHRKGRLNRRHRQEQGENLDGDRDNRHSVDALPVGPRIDEMIVMRPPHMCLNRGELFLPCLADGGSRIFADLSGAGVGHEPTMVRGVLAAGRANKFGRFPSAPPSLSDRSVSSLSRLPCRARVPRLHGRAPRGPRRG